MRVTVIVPIHNSEKYLRECIESALSQNFQEMEILCVDGGSTDRSREIIEKMQKKDARIIYMQDPNTSYGHKINVGIVEATGKYIAILESDDKMVPGMIEKLYSIAEKYDADVVDADYYELFHYKNKEWQSPVHKYSYPRDYNHLMVYDDAAKRDIVYTGIWTALYKREFITGQKIRLNESEGASYQDLSFLYLTSFLAQKVYHVGIPLYQYRVDNIGSSVKDERKIYEIIGECRYLKSDLKRRGIYKKEEWELYYTRKYNAFYWNYSRLSLKSRSKFLEKYKEELRIDIESGKIRRNMFAGDMYERTFLLLDDQEEFIKKVIEKEKGTFSTIQFIDFLESVDNGELVVFGAGALGSRIVEILQQNGNMLRGICDNSKRLQETVLGNYSICAVEEAVKFYPDALYIIANKKNGTEMKEQLLKAGILEANIILCKK